jgi:2-polyprenyl-3-methyl-5-hydroxy-6-metoxy-1,4-benzoquinol methylase
MASPNIPPSKNGAASPSIRYLDTTAAYDLWASVYDTDGNFLQALDSIEMRSLLPKFLAQISTPQPWKLVDLGCGTGRNTAALLSVPNANIVGLDASPKMLKVARSRLDKSDRLRLDVFDLLAASPPALNADAVISTLVLEHVPIDAFFKAAAEMLRPGGRLLVTNMNAEMGSISQAGFVDSKTGDKIRPKSYAHRLEDVVSGAKECGFKIAGEPLERSVDEATSEKLGPRAKKWIGVTVWFGIMFSKTA